MRTPFILLAGAATLALAAGAAQAQSYSWGNTGTTYFYSPSTTDNYSPSSPPPTVIPETPRPETAPYAVPPAGLMFYQAPDSYGLYRQVPDPAESRYDYRDEHEQSLGQGSGMDVRVGR